MNTTNPGAIAVAAQIATNIDEQGRKTLLDWHTYCYIWDGIVGPYPLAYEPRTVVQWQHYARTVNV